MTAPAVQFGVDTFADAMTDLSGRVLSDAETLRRTVDQGVLAEGVGLDFFSVGEHYRSDMLDSAPPVILAAIAGRTSRILLGTSVTVLSTQDPVRVFHQYSTLDAVSGGRAELVVGRASTIDSFPLFGFDLADYDDLFEQNLDLWVRLMRDQRVTWSGSTRAPLQAQTLYPRVERGALPTWVGVGGSPDSVVRAARHGLPLMIAIIGGSPARFAGHVELFYRALAQFDRPQLPVGQHAIGHVADTDAEAAETFWPAWQTTMTRAARERGTLPPTLDSYMREIEAGALMIGSPETVARKIADCVRALNLSRFDFKYALAPLPWERGMRSIELYGREVVPRVRELLGDYAPAERVSALATKSEGRP
ncbi:putative LLM family oxidoreductase [Diaminobutyricimonas aerilata]|uniref:Putative LLM family oxidoreductase n=1 Tax=Diaminobutyricimonas aerilata TaxID=1162967 RepID=A0A2M9CHW4_9MICO|nr:LLM class flavin-dependent oxidoreductase [Diaminobutyricimonas aerilata]PJJ71459.1 putative LLM family oxidoreductase [Diaminobutyricimonas aerilata]